MKHSIKLALVIGTLAVGFAAPATAAPAMSSGNGNKNYTCTNQGGGKDHKVNCVGTVNDNNVTVTVGDVNVLSGTQLVALQNVLNNAGVDVTVIKTAVAGFYLTNLGKSLDLDVITVCLVSNCS
ncbi:hypothetical protein BJY16_006908 [Actinoplanes octamycinicus]|uniref:Uncharacterized protein n=1 Tax=Actinoplanes octamycinicus TaxID=135948 RepID=A0A7W7MAU3_9ACTN|nr:hypothetical protein [Actinoplanes octamycinicus]MBB4743449.1 hypothetical protein [Actinoplanes octamycinicus]GIE63446.1 hypothetical protein Aoc01nite_88480 [Actinoplanes octamycinicus]